MFDHRFEGGAGTNGALVPRLHEMPLELPPLTFDSRRADAFVGKNVPTPSQLAESTRSGIDPPIELGGADGGVPSIGSMATGSELKQTASVDASVAVSAAQDETHCGPLPPAADPTKDAPQVVSEHLEIAHDVPPDFNKTPDTSTAGANANERQQADTPPDTEAREITMPVEHEPTRTGPDLREWHERVDGLMDQGARIITFRGAGKANGIEPGAATAVTLMLHDYVAGITASGTPVVLMYDGDGDNRQKPDVGSIFGGLVDSLGEDPNVTAIAAQTEGRYSSQTPDGPIRSATGQPYETYVFPDDVPGAHTSLTQSAALVNYAGYEQVFVGPAGPNSFKQLGDLSQKVAHRPVALGGVKVTVLATPNNPAISGELHAQLSADSDEQARAKAAARLDQRARQPYGALFTPAGEFSVDTSQFPGIEFAIHSVGGMTDIPEFQPAETQGRANPDH